MNVTCYTKGRELTGFDVSLEYGTSVIDELMIPSSVEGIKITHISGRMKPVFDKLAEKGIKEIKSLLIEDGITSIYQFAFAGIHIKIDKFHWPASCGKIPPYCFECSDIFSIEGIENVVSIGRNAFSKTNIAEFHWPSTSPTIPEGCFFYSTLKEIVGIESVMSIEASAFEGTGLKKINWPEGCKVIPTNCFGWCKEFQLIEGIEQVYRIESGAFAGTHLKEFNWPEKCKTISTGVFCQTPLESIKNIQNVTRVGKSAFEATNLTNFSWPSKCKVVPRCCFYACKSLEQIDGLEMVTEIKIGAFQGTAIKKFLWPASVSATETCLFLSNCEHLEEIIFEGTVIKDIDLECLSYLGNVKKIDLSRCGAVNLLNTTDPKYAEVKGKLILPYYVTEVS